MARGRLIWVWIIALMVAVMAGCAGDDSQTDPTPDANSDTSTDASTDGRTDATPDGRTDAPTDGRTDATPDGRTDASTDGRSDATDAPPADVPGQVDMPMDPPITPTDVQDAPHPPDADGGPGPQDVRFDVAQEPPVNPDVQDAPVPPPDTPDAGACRSNGMCPLDRPHCNTFTGACVSAASVALWPINPSIALGTEQGFEATITFTDNTTESGFERVAWASATPSVATITSGGGNATGVWVGSSVISVTLGGFSDSTTLTVTDATLSSISVTPLHPTILVGRYLQFTATGTFSDNTTQWLSSQIVSWTSGTPAVATILSNGSANAVSVGDSVITAAAFGTISGNTTLHVTNANATLSSIAVTPTTPTIARFTTQTFQAIGTYADGTTQNLTGTATWASSDVSVAKFSGSDSSHCIMTGIGTGTSTISATVGGISGSAALTVTGALLQSISVTPGTHTIAKDLVLPFTAAGTYSDSSTQNLTTVVTWTSSDTTKSVISNAYGSRGVAKTVDVGTSTISAAYGGVSGNTVLTINDATLESIGINPPNPTIAKGTTQPFAATGTYSDQSTQDITLLATWGTGNAGIGPISNAHGTKGQAFGLTPGDTTISATLSGISASTPLHVTNAASVSIGVTPTNSSIASGAKDKGSGEKRRASGRRGL